MKHLTKKLSIIALVASATPAVADTSLLASCIFPPQHFVCQQALPNWLDEVERVTEGRVTGIVTPTSVAPAAEVLTAVENGVADVAVQFNGLIENRVIGPSITLVPFAGARTAEAMAAALWELTEEHFADEFDTVHVLSQFVILPTHLFSLRGTPITSMDDFRGLRLWAISGTVAQLANETGAGVVATPAIQAPEIISRGVVDAAIGLDLVSVRSFQLIPYIRHVTLFSKGISTNSFSFVMNQDTWDSISEEDQAAIMSVSGEVFARNTSRWWDETVAGVYQEMEEAGVNFINASTEFEAAFANVAEGIRGSWIAAVNAKGMDGEALLEKFATRLAELTDQ